MSTNGYHPVNGDPLLTVGQIAQLCGLQTSRLPAYWIESGQLPAYRPRNNPKGPRLILRSDLRKFLDRLDISLEKLEAGGPVPPQLTMTPIKTRKRVNAPLLKGDVFSVSQVAGMFHITARTVTKWCNQGRLKNYRLPDGTRPRRILRAELIRFLKENNMPLGTLEEEGWHKVLLVSTDTHLLARLKELLPDNEGHRLHVAPNAFEAGLAVASIHPDTIIIDLGLGRSEGLAMARRLSGEEPRPRLVALACEDEGTTGQLTEAGFDDVFRRPFDPQLLAERLRHQGAEKKE